MKKGMALITILIIVFLLFSLVGAFLFLITNARRLNERYHENLIALSLAEAGVDFAIQEINFGGGDFLVAEGWSGANPKTTTINNFQDADGNIYGDINISVYDPGTDKVTIVSEGVFSSITGPILLRKVQVLLKKHGLFDYAMLTVESIDVGNKVDSYDSSQGPYGGDNVGQNGDIVTNGQGDPAITLRGSSTVEGDANTGPGGTVLLEGGASLSGEIYDTADVFIPPVTVPEDLENLASQGALVLHETDSLVLTDGDYKYDLLDLAAHATLTLNGDVNLYFTQNPSITTEALSQIVINGTTNIYFNGDINLGGQGILNIGSNPSDLIFYGTDSVININIAGVSDLYGVLYAPSADFALSGSSEIYGALVGKNATLTGSANLHYDENLRNDSPTIGYTPYAWQEK